MPLISVPNHVSPFQIELPADLERSVAGSLHVRPGTLHVTADEWAHIQLHNKDFAERVHVASAEDHAPTVNKAPPPVDEE
jgi:hypothetical protein